MDDKGGLGCLALGLLMIGIAVFNVSLNSWTARHRPDRIFISKYYAALNAGDYDEAMRLICPSARDALAAAVRRDVELRKQSDEPFAIRVLELERLVWPGPISELRGSASVAFSHSHVQRREWAQWRESVLGSCVERIDVQP